MKVYIAKDDNGSTHIFRNKPYLDSGKWFDRNGNGGDFYIGMNARIGIDLKPKQCKKVKLEFKEL